MEQQLSILTRTYDYLKSVTLSVKHFPRDQKFLLGQRLQEQVSDLLESVIMAYYSPRAEKAKQLKAINLQLEKIRYFSRLAFEIKCINAQKYRTWIEINREIGRITGAWLKSLSPAKG